MINRQQWMIMVWIGCIVVASCGPKNDPAVQTAPPAVSVNVYTVKEGKASYFDQYPATVTALNQIDIRPQVSGYITGIFFKEGEHVPKGQKLYSIDQQQYLAAFEQAKANMSVSQANLAKVQQDADRYQELAKQDAIARQILDHALADLESSKKQVEAAKANVKAVQTNLKYANIYSPFAGTIGISQVKLGTSVSPGQTLLNTLSSDDPIAVDVAIDDKQISRFIQLRQQKNGSRDSTFTLMLPGGQKYPYAGSISFLDRAVDPQTGTITARLDFPNPMKILRPGMTCNLMVLNNGITNSILIPYKTVVEQMAEYFVFKVDSGKVTQRKVILGSRINDKVIVKEGLKVNDQIVSDGVQKLHDGSAVMVAPPAVDSSKNKTTAGVK